MPDVAHARMFAEDALSVLASERDERSDAYLVGYLSNALALVIGYLGEDE